MYCQLLNGYLIIFISIVNINVDNYWYSKCERSSSTFAYMPFCVQSYYLFGYNSYLS